jgi:hypothetical protein
MAGQKLSGEKWVNHYSQFGKTNNVFKPQILTHVTWDNWVKEWEYLINALEGGQDFLRNNYLFRHERETSEAFNGRKTRAYYLNYVKLVIRLWSSYLKRTLPRRSVEDMASFKSFLNNMDLKDNNVNEFWIDRVFPILQCVGMVHLILADYVPEDVDASKILTLKDKNDSGAGDRVIIKLPSQMVNWRKRADGKYLWCIFQNINVKEYSWSDLGEKGYDIPIDDKLEVTYTVYTQDEEILLDATGKKVLDRQEHGLGEVPVVTVMGKPSEQWKDLGLPDMGDVAIMNREVYNISSLIQEFLYKQCFNFLAGPAELMSDKEGKVKLSLQGILPYSDPGVVPMYVSPPVDPADFLQKERDKIIQEMYRHSVLRDKSIERNDPASGISKAYDVSETTQCLEDKVQYLQDAEIRLYKLYAKKNNISLKKDDTELVQYPKEYDVTSVNEDLEILTVVFDLNISETLNKLKAERVAKKLLPNIKKEDAEKIIKEINEKNPAENDLFAMADKITRSRGNTNQGGNEPNGRSGSEITQDHNRNQ